VARTRNRDAFAGSKIMDDVEPGDKKMQDDYALLILLPLQQFCLDEA
jgi:hypothetical protein